MGRLYDMVGKFVGGILGIQEGICKSGDLGTARVREVEAIFAHKLNSLAESLRSGNGGMLISAKGAALCTQKAKIFEQIFFEKLRGVNEQYADEPFETRAYAEAVVTAGSDASGEVYKKVGAIIPKSRELAYTSELLSLYMLDSSLSPTNGGASVVKPSVIAFMLSQDPIFKHWTMLFADLPSPAYCCTQEFLAMCGYSLVHEMQEGDIIIFFAPQMLKNSRTKKMEELLLVDAWGMVGENGNIQMTWGEDPQIYSSPIGLLPSKYDSFQVFRKSSQIVMTGDELQSEIHQIEKELFKEGLGYFQERITALFGLKNLSKRRPFLDKKLIRASIESGELDAELTKIALALEKQLSMMISCPASRTTIFDAMKVRANQLAKTLCDFDGDLKLLSQQLRGYVWNTIRTELHGVLRKVIAFAHSAHLRTHQVISNSRDEEAETNKRMISAIIEEATRNPGGDPLVSHVVVSSDLLNPSSDQKEEVTRKLDELERFLESLTSSGEVEAVVRGAIETSLTTFSSERLQIAGAKLAQKLELDWMRRYHTHLLAWGLANYRWDIFSEHHTSFNPELIRPQGQYAFSLA
ncbi:MAG: hypothetical protein S4CHLAM102_15900 [Chlamydiia bacterium]|nr:hypothetical protein [Chlamydiia bacterium]